MVSIEYQGFFQEAQWMGLSPSGTTNGDPQSGRLMQAMQVSLIDPPPGMLVVYDVCFPSSGWEGSVSDGATAGKTDDADKFINAVAIDLVNRPPDSSDLAVAYRAFASNTQTWTNYCHNGEILSVTGGIEAIEIKIE